MEDAKDIILAARITKVTKLTSLSADYYPGVESFSLFLRPKSGSGYESGDILTFDAMLPDTDGEYVEVPVVLGDWSPIVFRAIKASSGLDLTTVDAYVAPIKDMVL